MFRRVDLDIAIADQEEAEHIEVRREAREIAEAMKEYFSKFSLEREELLKKRE